MVKVSVFVCPVHGEMELLKDVEKAYCPECGREMTKTGEYEEK